MFHTLFYAPIYNLLVFFLAHVPGQEIGVAIILVTIVVKLILYPIKKSGDVTQYNLKKIEKELGFLKEKHKADPKKSGEEMMLLYKREKINPFASIFALILQIPVFFALYKVFSHKLIADPASLYSFISFPEHVSTVAFGFLDVTAHYLYVGIAAGISSYFLARRQTSALKGLSSDSSKTPTFQEQLGKTMQTQLLYVIPFIVGFSATYFPAALGLYWITNNIISILQDVLIKRHIKKLSISK